MRLMINAEANTENIRKKKRIRYKCLLPDSDLDEPEQKLAYKLYDMKPEKTKHE